LWTVATVASLQDALTERVRLDGLDPARRYSVRVRDEVGSARWSGGITPGWLGKEPVEVPGSVLTEVGLQLPTLWPVQALVVEARAVPAG
jgi:alpha-galactosidase